MTFTFEVPEYFLNAHWYCWLSLYALWCYLWAGRVFARNFYEKSKKNFQERYKTLLWADSKGDTKVACFFLWLFSPVTIPIFLLVKFSLSKIKD